jgi:hypothetical protein
LKANAFRPLQHIKDNIAAPIDLFAQPTASR